VPLPDLVRSGAFRHDLLYRLAILTVPMPALRDRTGDVELLALHMLRKLAAQYGKAAPTLDVQSLRLLSEHRWPGNVRELENVIHRAVVLARGPVIQLQDVPLDVAMPDTPRGAEEIGSGSLREACDQFERQHVLRVLERVHWNVSRAARVLGVHRNTVLAKLAAWGIRRPGSEQDEHEAL